VRKLQDEELYDTKYYLSDKIKNDETEGACGTYGGEEICIQSFGGET
jgi:hypothetical protein